MPVWLQILLGLFPVGVSVMLAIAATFYKNSVRARDEKFAALRNEIASNGRTVDERFTSVRNEIAAHGKEAREGFKRNDEAMAVQTHTIGELRDRVGSQNGRVGKNEVKIEALAEAVKGIEDRERSQARAVQGIEERERAKTTNRRRR